MIIFKYENVFGTSVRWRQFCSGIVRLIDVISRLLGLTVMWRVTKHLTHGAFVVKGQTHRASAMRCGNSRHINKTGHSGGHNWSYYPDTLSSSQVKSSHYDSFGDRAPVNFICGLEALATFTNANLFSDPNFTNVPVLYCSLMWRIYDGPEGTS